MTSTVSGREGEERERERERERDAGGGGEEDALNTEQPPLSKLFLPHKLQVFFTVPSIGSFMQI